MICFYSGAITSIQSSPEVSLKAVSVMNKNDEFFLDHVAMILRLENNSADILIFDATIGPGVAMTRWSNFRLSALNYYYLFSL